MFWLSLSAACHFPLEFKIRGRVESGKVKDGNTEFLFVRAPMCVLVHLDASRCTSTIVVKMTIRMAVVPVCPYII